MSFVFSSLKIAVALAGVASLSGCLSAPTYGTGTSATTQLVEDLGEAVLIVNPDNNKDIRYEPRPELVRPAEGQQAGKLVPPQKSVASADNAQWIESPEEQRERLYAEIADNEGNLAYNNPLLTGKDPSKMTEQEQLEAFRKARKEATTVDISQRRYLIDPPAQYREPSSAEALSDLGQSERVKEARRKKLAQGKDPDKCFLFLTCNNENTTLMDK